MKRNNFILFSLFVFIFSIYSEKWVGQVATYQLLDGTKMANGEIFNKEGLNAACNGFKLGASVNVINVKTGKYIEVTITDRIRSDSNYFLLLTPKAAKELELEWETSLAVIDGSFTDVNSTEILAINGLVSEGSPDEEKIKKFPDINWPNKENDITKNVVEKEKQLDEKQNPKDEIKRDPDKKENKKIDIEYDYSPNIEKLEFPHKIMKQYAISEDMDEKLLPRNDFSLINPKEKERILSDDKNGQINPNNDIVIGPKKNLERIGSDSDELFNPKKDIALEPKKIKERISDDIDQINPKNDFAKLPEKDKNKIGDDIDSSNPKNDFTKLPEKDKNKIGDDIDSSNPKNDFTKLPEKDKNKIGDDHENIVPKKEITKNPFKKELLVNDDKEEIINPKDEFVKSPKNKEKFIENDMDSINIIEKTHWIVKLPKDQIFIRFSTSFDKEEGERRYNLFKNVFKNTIAYTENGKYILLIGPVQKSEIDATIKGLRSFGYKDSYVVSNF